MVGQAEKTFFMNTFFRLRKVLKYTWYRSSMNQKYLIDLYIVSSDLFSDVLDVQVKRVAELSTDHHLVVCYLRLSKNIAKRGIQQVVCDLPDQMGCFGGQRIKKHFASITVYHLSLDNFLMYPRTSRRNGCCSDQRSFHQLLKLVGENGLEWLAKVRKEHLDGTKRLKKNSSKPIRAQKDAFKAWLQVRSSSDLQSWNTEA